MKYLFICFAFLPFLAIAQVQSIEITKPSIDPVTQSVDGFSASELYVKSIEWINHNFNDASEVLGSKVENDFIRITGIAPNYYSTLGYSYDLKYTAKIEFKEGRYRITIESLYNLAHGLSAKVKLSDYFKSNGQPRKVYSNMISAYNKALTGFNISLYGYLSGKAEEKQGDNW